MKKITNNRPNTMCIEWILSNVCNYRCSYCVSALNDGSSGWPNMEDALKTFKDIDNRFPEKIKHFNITGGEPSLWPKLINFLQQLPESFVVEITTNGSRSLRYWKKLRDSCKLERLVISAHLAECDIDHILNVAELWQDTAEIVILVLMDPTRIHQVDYIFKEVENRGLEISMLTKSIKDFDNNGRSIEYSEDQKVYFNKKYINNKLKADTIPSRIYVDGEEYNYQRIQKDIMASRFNKFTGWMCNIGIDRIVIDQYGFIYPGTCTTGRKKVLGKLGASLSLPINATKCKTEYCDCISEIRIPKFNPD